MAYPNRLFVGKTRSAIFYSRFLSQRPNKKKTKTGNKKWQIASFLYLLGDWPKRVYLNQKGNTMNRVQMKGILFLAAMSFALLASMPIFADDAGAKNKIVIQVSTDDSKAQTIALNNAVNLQKEFGMDNIDIEVVAYGPGLGLLTANNKQSKRVKSLALQNIHFSACGNTMHKVETKTGKKVQLTEGVQVVKAGVSRIMQLQQNGYAYVRP